MMKYLDIKEFREHGYLQEINRLFLHPLGLALEITDDDTGEWLSGVWDYRDDPEGIFYADGVIDAEKANRVAHELAERVASRLDKLGYVIQPVQDDIEVELVKQPDEHDRFTDDGNPHVDADI